MRPYLILALIGTAWGLTIPVTRIAVLEGHGPLGFVAWQTVLMSLILTAIVLVTGRRFALSRAALWLYLVVALLGTLLPNIVSYRVASELPAGILSILIAVVPMFALPIAILLGLERPEARRAIGLVFGLVAIVMIVGPDASLPRAGDGVWVVIALIAPLCYGCEGNYLALRGTGGLDPIEVLWGASIIGALIAVPLAVATGSWIAWPMAGGAVLWAIPLIAGLHAFAYAGYVGLVGSAGAVFAAQVAYIVTASGVLWSMILLRESYALWIWVAFALMLAGVALVQPRRPAGGSDAA